MNTVRVRAQIALPAARPEVAVERHLDALLARDLEHGEKPAEPVV